MTDDNLTTDQRLDKLETGMKLQAEATVAMGPALIETKALLDKADAVARVQMRMISDLQIQLGRTIDSLDLMAQAHAVMCDRLTDLESKLAPTDENG